MPPELPRTGATGVTLAALAVVLLGGATACAVGGSASAATGTGGETMIDFASDGEAARWYASNDPVMGGVSEGALAVENGRGLFWGEVSFENNGGFASVRRRPADYRLEGAAGLRVRARGDGKSYRVLLSMPELRDGVSYQQELETIAGEWTVYELPFDRFSASYRGRAISAPALAPEAIDEIGFLIAGQEGPFELEIEWVAAMPAPSSP